MRFHKTKLVSGPGCDVGISKTCSMVASLKEEVAVWRQQATDLAARELATVLTEMATWPC